MKNIDEFFDRVRVAFAYHDYDEWKHLNRETPMTNEITHTNGQVPAVNDEAVEGILRETARSNPMLRFKEGDYFIGEDRIALGREYIAYPMDWVRGFVKWEDGVMTEAKLLSGALPMLKREELGDNDEEVWEKDKHTGEPRDPWQRQNVLPMEDIESGEYLLFTTPSIGGKIAVERLANFATRNFKHGKHVGAFPSLSWR